MLFFCDVTLSTLQSNILILFNSVMYVSVCISMQHFSCNRFTYDKGLRITKVYVERRFT